MGGNHSIIVTLFTSQNHTLDNTFIGKRGTIGLEEFILVGIEGDNLFLSRPITGTITHWLGDSSLGAAGDLVFDTATVPVTDPRPAQFYPALQNTSRQFFAEGGRTIVGNGSYFVKSLRIISSYQVANPFQALQAIEATAGTNDVIDLNDPSLESQFGVELEYLVNRYAVTQRNELTVFQDHFRRFWWPLQFDTINRRAGETTHLLVPNCLPIPSGEANDGGGVRDFAAYSDITNNNLEYYIRSAFYAPSTDWQDGIQRCPTTSMFEIRDSGGNPIHRFVMHNDGDLGRTSNPVYSEMSLFMSASEKVYPAVDYNREVQAGLAQSVISAWGWIDPAIDPEASINFTYQKWGGEWGFVWHSFNALANYLIPVPDELIGKKIRVVKQNSNITLTDTVVQAGGISVTKTAGAGGFELVLH